MARSALVVATPGRLDRRSRPRNPRRAAALATLGFHRHARFSHTDFRAKARTITTPTLIIHGDNDANVPVDASSRLAAELIPSAEFEIYSGAPHGLFYTHRAELNADIAAFASEGGIALETAA
ncbi:MAG: alpha/beta fold hydrolase [Hyphomicrobium sp.]